MGQVGDKLVYGNTRGHGLLEEIEEMKKDIAILMARDKKKADQIGEHQKEIVSLKKRVKLLSQSSEGYLSIRRRFLDVYKRDVKEMRGLQGSNAIREGNLAAHEGDAIGDAMLFDHDTRTDRSLYRELYGLDDRQVLEFRT